MLQLGSMDSASPADIFETEVARLRDSGALGRSDVLGRLFDYLVERSRADDPPKEAEVALEVFGKDSSFDAIQDASVRVAVLRLRRKLDDHYATRDDPRLSIPKGEYRLALSLPEPAAESAVALPAPQSPSRLASGHLVLILSVALLVLSAIGWTWMLTRGSGGAKRDEALALAPWSKLNKAQPVYLVVGDYYIFGENNKSGEVSRLVREFAINSKDDLDEYLMMNPDKMGEYVDLGLSYLPRGTASVLSAIQPVVHWAGPGTAGADHVLSASNLNAQRIKDGQIVYVGWMSGLGLLRDPLFSASNFQVGGTYDELIDRTDAKHYITDWDQTDQRKRHHDYGYFASFPGPSGNPIIVIAGIRDAGLTLMSDVVTNPAELHRLSAQAKSPAFEALYEVQSLGGTNLASRLVAVHPLKTQSLWERDGYHLNLPDELNPVPAGQ